MFAIWWTPKLNAGLGSVVVVGGAWLAWGGVSLWEMLFLASGVTGFLLWQGNTIGRVWGWTTLLLGLESFAWPLLTMLEVRATTPVPTDAQMVTILFDVTIGLFAAVFWISFSYGLFKRARQLSAVSPSEALERVPSPRS